MLSSLVLASVLSILPAQTPASGPIDVSTLKVAPATTVVELDLGKLKGDLRQIGWSADGTELYVQTADGDAQSPRLRHYVVALAGGAVKPVEKAPDWAETFWAFKSDRAAPGIGSLLIDMRQKTETVKVGTGSGRPDAAGSGSGDSVTKTAESQHENIVQLVLFDEAISEFVNERPIPGLMFSWGPASSGAIAFTNRDGRLMLLDQNKHKQTVSGAKDALLPAWSTDGARLAWVQKSGRKKYTLVWATVSR